MNYLGHSYFSQDKNSLFITGNVLGDFYKGRIERLPQPKELVDGVFFHRTLDRTTDENPFIIKSKNSLTSCGLYKGVVIDIFTDYFFAKNWNKISKTSLDTHTHDLYEKIDFSYDFLTLEAQKTFFYLKRDNVLSNYQEIDFIEGILYHMSSFSKKGIILKESIKYLKKNEKFYEDNFFDFLNSFSYAK